MNATKVYTQAQNEDGEMYIFSVFRATKTACEIGRAHV